MIFDEVIIEHIEDFFSGTKLELGFKCRAYVSPTSGGKYVNSY